MGTVQRLATEARVNEYAGLEQNPDVPWLPDEFARDAAECQDAECQDAGAAILHFHGRQPGGAPDHRFESYRDTILATRAGCDALIHPTLGYVTVGATAEQRIANILRLAQDPATRPEFAPMDMDSTNVDGYDLAERRYTTKGLIYRNGTETLEYFAEAIHAQAMAPYLVAWNIGFTRQIGAFPDMGLRRGPAYVCFCLTGRAMLAGHPGTAEGLDAYTRFLPQGHAVEWTACNFNGDLLKLTEETITEGGHVSIGLGDYAYAEYGRPTNAELIRRVADQARSLGREVATPPEARAILGVPGQVMPDHAPLSPARNVPAPGAEAQFGLLRTMTLICRFELRTTELFLDGTVKGTAHSSVGRRRLPRVRAWPCGPAISS